MDRRGGAAAQVRGGAGGAPARGGGIEPIQTILHLSLRAPGTDLPYPLGPHPRSLEIPRRPTLPCVAHDVSKRLAAVSHSLKPPQPHPGRSSSPPSEPPPPGLPASLLFPLEGWGGRAGPRQDMARLMPQAVASGLRRVLGCKRQGIRVGALTHFQSPQFNPSARRREET